MPRAASFDGDVPQDQAGHRVMGLMPTNLSRPEITGELSVSPNTVNAHIRAIYAKLQVRDRSSAVRRARELRLLAAAGQTR